MKKLFIFGVMALGVMLSPQLFAQQGIGTDQPDKSAALEILSSKRGLLIPRFGIPDLDQAAPVTDPAHSLLVFNDGSASTPPGFYWWNQNANEGAGGWKAVTGEVSGPGDEEINISGAGLINVSNLGDNAFEISLETGQEGEVLVTDADGQAAWTPLSDFLNDLVLVGENGITVFEDPLTGEQIVRLGGVLTEETTVIQTDGLNNSLAITNLVDITEDVQDDQVDLDDYFIVIMDDSGILQRVSPSELSGNTELDFSNALTRDGDQVTWGGQLLEDTQIDLNEHSLEFQGLTSADGANEILVAQGTGELRTVARSISFNITADAVVTDQIGYTFYIQEVNIDVDVANLNQQINLSLPDAASAEGQVINIKLIDPSQTGEADNYLHINEGSTLLTYGALPHQGWVFKSNGTNWRIIAKN